MGWAKETMLKHQERGYGNSDKIICHKCVGNYYLKNYIKVNGSEDTCDYCKANDISIPLEDLMEPIMKGIEQEYEDATGCMGYDGREGGYQGATTYDSYELIEYELYDEFSFSYKDIYDDVFQLIDDSITWCQRDPYGDLPYDEDLYTWEEFANKLKKYGKDAEFKEDNDSFKVYNRADKILERIDLGIKKLGLIEVLPVGTSLWRARAHMKSEIVNSAASLGSPKEEIAGCNRMNYKGVSTFYGSFEKETALKEIANQKEPLRTIGRFHNLLPLAVVNLYKLKSLEVPSLFDIEQSEERILLIFLKQFNIEISKPIGNEKENEYLPTQKMMEYFRKTLATNDGLKIDGVIYTSAQNKGEQCCALFVNSKQCSDNNDKILKLDSASIEHLLKNSFEY